MPLEGSSVDGLSAVEVKFNLRASLGMVISGEIDGKDLGKLVVADVFSDSQAAELGVKEGWEVLSFGGAGVTGAGLTGDERIGIVESVVKRLRGEAQADAATPIETSVVFAPPDELIATTEFDPTEMAGSLEKLVFSSPGGGQKTGGAGVDDEGAGADVADAFAGYSPPTAPNGRALAGQLSESERAVLRKIKELHNAMMATKRANDQLNADVDRIAGAHNKEMMTLRRRERSAGRVLSRLRERAGVDVQAMTQSKRRGAKRPAWTSRVAASSHRNVVSATTTYGKTISTAQNLVCKPLTSCSRERRRRRLDYVPPAHARVGLAPKRPVKMPAFSSGVASNSHRFNRTKATGRIRVPPRLLELAALANPDYPKPILTIALGELVRQSSQRG